MYHTQSDCCMMSGGEGGGGASINTNTGEGKSQGSCIRALGLNPSCPRHWQVWFYQNHIIPPNLSFCLCKLIDVVNWVKIIQTSKGYWEENPGSPSINVSKSTKRPWTLLRFPCPLFILIVNRHRQQCREGQREGGRMGRGWVEVGKGGKWGHLWYC